MDDQSRIVKSAPPQPAPALEPLSLGAAGIAVIAYLVILEVIRQRGVELGPEQTDGLRRLPQVAVVGSACLYWGSGKRVAWTVLLAGVFVLCDLAALCFLLL